MDLDSVLNKFKTENREAELKNVEVTGNTLARL